MAIAEDDFNPATRKPSLAERVRAFNQGLEDTLIEVFRLKTYGSSLWTTSVSNWAFWMALLLGIQFAVETWAWQRAWYYGVSSVFVSVGMALAFATAVVVYDRSLAVSDQDRRTGFSFRVFGRKFRMSGSWLAFAFRGITLLLLSFVNAIPVELAVFESEISHRINETEVRRLDSIRERATRTENERFDRLISETRNATDTRRGEDRNNVAARREALLQTHRDRREALTATVRAERMEALREVGGRRGSNPGAGQNFRAIQSVANQAQGNLDAFEIQARAELAQFEASVGNEINTNDASRGERIVALETQRRDKLHELELLQPTELVRRYGGSFEEPRGFLQRYAVLQELAAESPRVALIVAGLRAVMIAFGLFIMAHKLQAPLEVRMYYSLATQAAEGNEDAMKFLRIRGINDFKAHAYGQEVSDPLDRLYYACLMLSNELLALQSEKIRQARSTMAKAPHTGMPLAHIQGELLKHWEKRVVPRLHKLLSLRYDCRAEGIYIEPWPAELNGGKDPTEQGYAPWNVERQELLQLGWVDPDPIHNQVRDLTMRLIARRRDLSQLEGDLVGKTMSQIKDRMSPNDILEYRRKFWFTDVVPVLMDIENLQNQLLDQGKSLAWPNHYPDPSRSIEERILRPNLDALREVHQAKPNGAHAPIN